MSKKRVILIVLDSVGIGAAPDAADYGDAGADTLRHTLGATGIRLPNLARLGLFQLYPDWPEGQGTAPKGVLHRGCRGSKTNGSLISSSLLVELLLNTGSDTNS